MTQGFLKVLAACPKLIQNAPKTNVALIKESILGANAFGAELVVFPELCILGAAAKASFCHPTVLDAAESALGEIVRFSKERSLIIIVGCPIRIDDKVCNAAAIILKGKIIGLVPKVDDPDFCSGKESEITVCGTYVPFGADLLFKDKNFCFGVCVGEQTVGGLEKLSDAGAQLIVNISSAPSRMDSSSKKLAQAKQLEDCAYVYVSDNAASGSDINSGLRVISEGGQILAADEGDTSEATSAEIDMDLIQSLRLRNRKNCISGFRFIGLETPKTHNKPLREYSRLPFLPSDPKQYDRILDILSRGLFQRMSHIKTDKVVFGLSGGLDSALTAIICYHTFNKYKLDLRGINAILMPSDFSGQRTKSNAKRLANLFNFSIKEIPISKASEQMQKAIGLTDKESTTFENIQARQRAQILLNLSNSLGALQLGTGDLSENALGFSTYGGDQLAFFNPNSGMPKTLIRGLIADFCQKCSSMQLHQTLLDIIDTPVSPELKENQLTENIIGSYEVQDFFVYHIFYKGATPKKALFLAQKTFGEYSKQRLVEFLKILITRFFANRFKLNASCDGINITGLDLCSPAIPSDISAECFLEGIE